jgi:alkaline phosphatase D
VAELHRDPLAPDDRALAVEFVTPSLTSQNLDDKLKRPRRAAESLEIERRAVEALPHWHWVDLDSHGYTIVDVTPDRVTTEYWHLDTILEPSPNEELASAWTVEHGRTTPVRRS